MATRVEIPTRADFLEGQVIERVEIRMDRDEHICTRCGRTEAENGQKLDVDHILPWRQLIAEGIEVANHPSNLTSLCRKCHRWKTATVEHKWLTEGDCLAMSEYQRRIKLPPLFAGVE